MATPATYTWVPCTARVIVIDGFGPVPRGTLQVASPPLAWPLKDPGDVLDYVLDFSEALAGSDGDAIATLDVTITPGNAGDLLLHAASAEGCKAILWLAQGIVGVTYAVTVSVGTQSGRVIARTVALPVASLASTSLTAGAITDQTGAPIADQAGNALTTG